MSNDKIDFVITWLDEKDEKWIKEKQKYNSNVITEANNEIRYRQWDTLKYWFRGVERFAPWVNKIFFITYGHIPIWLNTENPKLRIITHREFINEECLPTFNSNAIELNIYKIPDLSEHFVYFNDDMFIVKKMNQNCFFKNNLPRDEFIFNAVTVKGENDIVEHSILNNMEIISRHFNKRNVIKNNWKQIFNIKYGKANIRNICLLPWKYFSGIYNQHIPISYLKSTWNKVWEEEKDNLYNTIAHRFRDKTDYNHWIFRYWQLMSGKFIPISMKKNKFYDLKNDNKKFFDEIKSGKYDMVCINDSDPNLDFEKVKNEQIQMFESILPEKCSFEN